MLFGSYEFIFLFLPITVFGFFAIARTYAWWSFECGLLIVATIVANYGLGRRIQALADRNPARAS